MRLFIFLLNISTRISFEAVKAYWFVDKATAQEDIEKKTDGGENEDCNSSERVALEKELQKFKSKRERGRKQEQAIFTSENTT